MSCPVERGRDPSQGARRPGPARTGAGQDGPGTQADMGDPASAMAAGQQALKGAVALGDRALQILASHSLGQAYHGPTEL
jgi:hypothetical protein